jgi:hypothetical protein
MLRTLFTYDILPPVIPRYNISAPEDEVQKFDDIQVRLKCELKMHDNNTFVGSDLIAWLITEKLCDSQQSALQMAHTLVDAGVINHSHSTFRANHRYRLRIDTDYRGVLNLFHLSDIDPNKTAVQIITDLRNMMNNLRSMFITENGDAVDYPNLRRSKEFNVDYRNAAYQLRNIDLSTIDDTERKCLFINLYNTLMIHALIVFGVPTSVIGKKHFFYNAKYIVGGFCFSLNDIEHGILRRDKHPYGALMHVFTKSDPRKKFMVAILDPRIHFALNCGAKSCPPINVYRPDKLDQQLDIAARAFCEDCKIDMKDSIVTLSSIFKWYYGDFAQNNRQLVEFLRNYVEQEVLDLMLRSQVSITIKYSVYDWSLNKK